MLNMTYPAFNMIALCCSCGKAIDRLNPYASLTICDLEEISKPWITTAKVFDDREFAVLCHDCDPGLSSEKSVEKERIYDDRFKILEIC